MLKQFQYFLAGSKLATQIPGFRTRTPWKQGFAMVGYPILLVLAYVYMRYRMDIVETVRDGVLLGLNNFIVVLCVIIIPFILLTNLKDVRKKLPLYKNSTMNRKMLGAILTVILLFSIMGVATNSISKLYSDKFIEKIK